MASTTTPPAPRRTITPPPPPLDGHVSHWIARDLLRAAGRVRHGVALPPGSLRPSVRNTWRTIEDPLGMLLEHYRDYGPVFTIRTLHEPVIWAVSPDTNQQILVSEFDAFSWRDGHFRDLHPLLGDGMLNIDGAYHRDMRRLLMPAFHHERVNGVADEVVAEAVAAAERLEPGTLVDMNHWTREVALRIALRILLGITDTPEVEHRLADAFERALGFHGVPFAFQVLRGPGTPFARAQVARDELDQHIRGEIEQRRKSGDHGTGVLAMLLDATDADGQPLSVSQVRDQAVTVLFAGHDTTTATLTFLLYEIGLTLGARDALEAELDTVLGGAPPKAEHLTGTALPVLERTIDETLRRYPAAWVGPRFSKREVEIGGHKLPPNIAVHYSSWATHHLPDVWPNPLAFDPDRFLPEAVAGRHKGAYIPFGGGSRMCLGKRFGQVELRALTAVLVQRLRFAPDPSETLKITTTPTLGPKGGLHFTVSARG